MTKRKREQPEIDTTSVLEGNGALTDQYRAVVTAALPAGVSPSDEFWRELESAIATFFSLQQHRARKLTELELERWQTIDRLVSNLADELRKVRRQGRWPDFAFDQPVLWRIKRKAEAAVLGHQTIVAKFSRRQNPHRAYLYGAVLDLWRWHLGQKLKFSRAEERGVPHGPLIDFLRACIGPVLGAATPTASGLASIVDRERKLGRIFAGVGAAVGTGRAAATGGATSVLNAKK